MSPNSQIPASVRVSVHMNRESGSSEERLYLAFKRTKVTVVKRPIELVIWTCEVHETAVLPMLTNVANRGTVNKHGN